MIKIVIGGAIEKQNIANLVEKIGGENVKVEVMSDMQAAMAIKTGKADYYLGACHTGGGGALSMAMALLTRDKCATVSMPGKPPKEENIVKVVSEGKIAFGFTGDHYEIAVPVILGEILNK